MTPNEIMIIESMANQTRLLHGVVFQLMKLVELQLLRENGVSKMPKAEFDSYVSRVMISITPIIDILNDKE